MAINKKLIHFSKGENFDTQKANNNILDSSICFIQDRKTITTHNTEYRMMGWSYLLEPKLALPGDICLYDKNADKLIIVSASEDLANYPSDNYSPVGVVVIPNTHNVYGDDSCGVMSIKPMSYSTPDTGGTSEQQIYWGGYGTDISTLSNLNRVCYVGSNGTVHSTVKGTTTNYTYLPSDKFSTVQNPYDTDTYYYDDDSYSYYIPSPFLTDGSRNPAYYQTSSPSSTLNAMADFDGVGNTEILTGLATFQSIWKIETTIKNNANAGCYPAACCCWRYHTDGTKQGDWYLPACGELGYIMPNFNKINTTINTLTNAYSVGVQLNSSNTYWSSSENSGGAMRVSTNNGYVGNYSKNSKIYVRAFLRVKP